MNLFNPEKSTCAGRLIAVPLLLLLSIRTMAQTGTTLVDSLETVEDNIRQELVRIKENHYVIRPIGGVAGNIGVFIGEDKVIMVDDQWSKYGPKIKTIIKSITDKPIGYIINTHFHFDHVNGNKFFGSENVPIIAHQNVRNRLASDQWLSSTGKYRGKIFQRAFPPKALPVITFRDTLILYERNERIKLIYFKNAHTDGDAIVHFEKADIYQTGDIFVTYGLPFVDEDMGGDIYETIRTIEYLISVSNNDTRFIPGHGPVCTVDDLIRYRDLLTTYRDQVAELVKKKYSLEEIMSEIKVPGSVGGFREEFIPHIYRMTIKRAEFVTNPD